MFQHRVARGHHDLAHIGGPLSVVCRPRVQSRIQSATGAVCACLEALQYSTGPCVGTRGVWPPVSSSDYTVDHVNNNMGAHKLHRATWDVGRVQALFPPHDCTGAAVVCVVPGTCVPHLCPQRCFISFCTTFVDLGLLFATLSQAQQHSTCNPRCWAGQAACSAPTAPWGLPEVPPQTR
jgi:hypothetical protein